jgi:nicotinate-nucleotide pyrophosphorylase (carboxylating)
MEIAKPKFQNDIIALALAEDVGSGDVTCRYFVDPAKCGTATIIAKESAVVAGAAVAAEVFSRVDEALAVKILRGDGSAVQKGDVVMVAEGAVGSLLTAERVALNFLQRLSGVATLTRKFVGAIAGTRAQILDTRKTTPGLRLLEKAAVAAGGGTNHRIGLFDMVMVKDNHLAADCGRDFLQSAITRFRSENHGLRVELEADTLEQVRDFLTLDGVDVILLDNMSCETMRAAVALAAGRVKLEASGGVSLETVRAIAETGVDFISIGALTHSARAMDFSLELS